MMSRNAVALIVFAVLPLLASVTVLAQEKTDVAQLQGKWRVTKMIKRGDVAAVDQDSQTWFTFSAEKRTLLLERDPDRRTFQFKIDATKNPKQIDLTAEDGRFKGQTIPGIYRLNGNVLVMCLPHDDNRERPDAFEAFGGAAPSRMLFTMQRVKE